MNKRKVFVIIGANFGDEGKGLVTDFVVSKARNPLVIRYNGGAQAGHTIVTPDGRRHVFSHFGSGTFLGAPTYLGPNFIVNPMAFLHERELLAAQEITPIVYAHRLCRVTTPYDVILNQAREQERGDKPHGSCGFGIFETMQRHKKIPLVFSDLYDDYTVNRRLHEIIGYALGEAEKFDVDKDKTVALLTMSELRLQYLKDCSEMARCHMQPIAETVGRYKDKSWQVVQDWDGDLVFEGAQGLALDMKMGMEFPYLTPSHPGLYGHLSEFLATLFNVELPLEIIYVTRTYLTRHGAGPLLGECKPEEIVKEGVEDKTNLHNKFQGSLRYASLNIEDLEFRIRWDLMSVPDPGVPLNPQIALTCTDHVSEAMVADLIPRLPFKVKYISTGDTRQHVSVLN